MNFFTIHLISTWQYLLIKRNKLFITMTVFGLKEREKLTIDSQIGKVQIINTWWHEPLIWSLSHCCALSNVVRGSLCLCIWPFILLTDRRDPALALATDSFSFSAARRWTAWKLFRAAEKSLISRSLWIFCCLWTPPRRAKQMVWHKEEFIMRVKWAIWETMNDIIICRGNPPPLWKSLFIFLPLQTTMG